MIQSGSDGKPLINARGHPRYMTAQSLMSESRFMKMMVSTASPVLIRQLVEMPTSPCHRGTKGGIPEPHSCKLQLKSSLILSICTICRSCTSSHIAVSAERSLSMQMTSGVSSRPGTRPPKAIGIM